MLKLLGKCIDLFNPIAFKTLELDYQLLGIEIFHDIIIYVILHIRWLVLVTVQTLLLLKTMNS